MVCRKVLQRKDTPILRGQGGLKIISSKFSFSLGSRQWGPLCTDEKTEAPRSLVPSKGNKTNEWGIKDWQSRTRKLNEAWKGPSGCESGSPSIPC